MAKSNAIKEVLDYLNCQNRPYSAQDIFQNMGKDLGKTAVVRALDELSKENRIKEKIYGKQKVYVADQDVELDPLVASHGCCSASVNESEIKVMDEQINDLTHHTKVQKEQLQKLESELNAYCNALTTEQAINECKKYQQQAGQLQEKILQLKEGRVLVSAEDREKVQSKRTHYVKEWKKRKRMVVSTDITDSILEGYPKTKKQLFEEIGLETDEDCCVRIPEL